MDPLKLAKHMQSILNSGKEVGITQKANAEFEKNTGASLGAAIPVFQDMGPEGTPGDVVLACTTLEPGEELILPDNITALCGFGCGRTIQHRPGYPDWVVKACLICIDERPKTDHS